MLISLIQSKGIDMKIACPNCKKRFDWEQPQHESFVGDADIDGSRYYTSEPKKMNTISCPYCQHAIPISS
jgi:DNA-directed RNA polymerase subunit RPC12/RpoP